MNDKQEFKRLLEDVHQYVKDGGSIKAVRQILLNSHDYYPKVCQHKNTQKIHEVDAFPYGDTIDYTKCLDCGARL